MACVASLVALAGCGSDDEPAPSPFSLRFAVIADGTEIGCSQTIDGFAARAGVSIGLSDLRFYVSNLRFVDVGGRPIELTLDTNEFQYQSAAGAVALVDLTGNTEGTCSGNAIAFAEGTARTNAAVTGETIVEKVGGVSFDIGVPQALMQEIIATHTVEGAPSPLSEMYWTWATGYRHFVLNFAVETSSGASGGGYVHVGSRDCGPEEGLALEDRSTCGFVNTPQVSLTSFDLARGKVAIDVRRLLTGLDFIAPIYDPMTFEVIGSGPGVECHSSPTQPDCATVFTNFGLDMATGAAAATENTAFGAM